MTLFRPDPARLRHPVGVVGLGNPLMGDDGVGPWVVAQLHKRHPSRWVLDLGSDLLGLSSHGPYPKTLLVVDAARTGQVEVGAWQALTLEQVKPMGGLRSSHQLSAVDALALEQQRAPGSWVGVTLYWLLLEVDAIEIGQGLTPAVEKGAQSLLSWLDQALMGKKQLNQ
ncbi:hydrogenase maturation protease [Magnetococcus sp. PR-3]|uniref:hydrogenase maturation protease n=1 Tax=Magnetococcus sp. PR-3 TaxID=3120355 RepID=UPI002FCE39B2